MTGVMTESVAIREVHDVLYPQINKVRPRLPGCPKQAGGEERCADCADTTDGGCGLKCCCMLEGESDYTVVTSNVDKYIKKPLSPLSLSLKVETSHR
jgi:hypothetical protein